MRKLGLSVLFTLSALMLSHGRTEGACVPLPCVTPPLMTHVHLNPVVIHLAKLAKWVIAYIEPVGFSPSDVDISSLRLAGSVSPDPKFRRVGDHDLNGLPELMVRFSGAEIGPLLTLGVNNLEVTASLVTGEHCSGSDTVRVVDPPPASTRVHFDPGVIHLAKPAKWVIAYIEPVGFSPSDIDISSLRLAGSVSPDPKFTKVVDHDLNGLPELMVRFSSAEIGPLLTLGMNQLEMTASLVTGEHCSGSDTVRAIDPQPSPPAASVAPNPLNPVGSLSFYVGTAGHVRVQVFDRGGGLVRTMLDVPAMAVGSQHVSIDGRGDRGAQMASGIYFYRINTPDGTVTGRFTILK